MNNKVVEPPAGPADGAGAATETFESLISKDLAELSSEESKLRADPAYLAYYYSNVSANPNLPAPVISWDNWHVAQSLQQQYPYVFSPHCPVVRKPAL
eukprot:scaffold3110_cov341-Prasinococcus_capsulatus_cf.AAC.9